jgi:hypothetical protein
MSKKDFQKQSKLANKLAPSPFQSRQYKHWPGK